MKKIIGIIALCVIGHVNSQELETVLSVVQVRHEISWYEQQLNLWEKEVDKNDQDANAWYNYYNASRALKIVSDSNKCEKYIELCHTISENSYKAIPNSFEANHLMWRDGGNDQERLHYLYKAAEISPDDSRYFYDILINYVLACETKKIKEICAKIYANNDLPAAILNWGYNVLAGLDENAIIFAAGDNDTYALWLIQGAKNFRPDVMILNTSLILMEDYQKKVLTELNIPALTDEDQKLFPHIFKNNEERPVYVAISAIRQFDDVEVKKNLYLTGLEYKYSTEQIDNLSTIRRNYEKRYLIDHLSEHFTTHIADKVAKHLEVLYLPSMVKLYKHYKSTEESHKAQKLSDLMKSISEKTDQEEYINELLKEEL